MSPRLPDVKAAHLGRALERAGFRKVRQKGSHATYKHSDGRRATIPVHPARTVPKATLRAILRDVGLSVDDLLKLL
jgi:predicted RNA binding protein YcfA (HicA-like mRNA interferase family)